MQERGLHMQTHEDDPQMHIHPHHPQSYPQFAARIIVEAELIHRIRGYVYAIPIQ